MKKIIGKLKNDQNVLVFDNAELDGLKDVYKVPNVTLAIPFEVDTRKLAEGEWYYFVLTEEEKQEMLGGFVSEDTSVGLDTMVADYYSELKAIYLVSGEERIFTKVTPRQVLRSQKYVSFGEKPSLVEQGNAIRLTGEVDAYWNGSRLFFKKFTLIQSLFPGIKKMYRQVTEQGTNEFLSSTLFELKSEMSSEIIGLRNRRKMVSIIESKTIDLKDEKSAVNISSMPRSTISILKLPMAKLHSSTTPTLRLSSISLAKIFTPQRSLESAAKSARAKNLCQPHVSEQNNIPFILRVG